MNSSIKSVLSKFLLCLGLLGLISCSTERQSTNPKVVKEESDDAKKYPAKFVVLIISGFDSDPSPEQLAGTAIKGMGNSGMYQLMGDLEQAGIECKFFNWNGTLAGNYTQKKPPGVAKIASWIRECSDSTPNTKFICIGHSWGGHTLIDAVEDVEENDVVEIPLTFLLDASSALRGKAPNAFPSKIESVVNYYTNNIFCWGNLSFASRIENISLGDPENKFMKNGFPNYSSSFDIDAHNSAEWDQKIHQDIVKRILALVNRDSNDRG